MKYLHIDHYFAHKIKMESLSRVKTCNKHDLLLYNIELQITLQLINLQPYKSKTWSLLDKIFTFSTHTNSSANFLFSSDQCDTSVFSDGDPLIGIDHVVAFPYPWNVNEIDVSSAVMPIYFFEEHLHQLLPLPVVDCTSTALVHERWVSDA